MASCKPHETLIIVDKVDRDHLKKLAQHHDRTMKNTLKRMIKSAYNIKFGKDSYNEKGLIE